MPPLFSRRAPAVHAPNRITDALARRTAPYVDLTLTNPTAVELAFGTAHDLSCLADPRAARYEPDPRGLAPARHAVARYYEDRGLAIDPAHVFLSASSSESYAWILKLLCEPGDAVLVPAPSYPLLPALAELEGVRVRRYRLTPEDGWGFHASEIEHALSNTERDGSRVKAVVIVGPNNPTGTSISARELTRLFALANERGFAVISDEVFLDYRFDERPGDVRVAAAESGALVFSLGGLSKAAALPGLKLGWILANGPPSLLAPALERLEWIADAFLSVGTPVQVALPRILERAGDAAALVTERLRGNLDALSAAFPENGEAHLLPLRGGWSAILRVPATRPEEELVLSLLSTHGVLVHPGYFFDFPFEAFLVLSLLPRPEDFREGLKRLASLLYPSGPIRRRP